MSLIFVFLNFVNSDRAFQTFFSYNFKKMTNSVFLAKRKPFRASLQETWQEELKLNILSVWIIILQMWFIPDNQANKVYFKGKMLTSYRIWIDYAFSFVSLLLLLFLYSELLKMILFGSIASYYFTENKLSRYFEHFQSPGLSNCIWSRPLILYSTSFLSHSMSR